MARETQIKTDQTPFETYSELLQLLEPYKDGQPAPNAEQLEEIKTLATAVLPNIGDKAADLLWNNAFACDEAVQLTFMGIATKENGLAGNQINRRIRQGLRSEHAAVRKMAFEMDLARKPAVAGAGIKEPTTQKAYWAGPGIAANILVEGVEGMGPMAGVHPHHRLAPNGLNL